MEQCLCLFKEESKVKAKSFQFPWLRTPYGLSSNCHWPHAVSDLNISLDQSQVFLMNSSCLNKVFFFLNLDCVRRAEIKWDELWRFLNLHEIPLDSTHAPNVMAQGMEQVWLDHLEISSCLKLYKFRS